MNPGKPTCGPVCCSAWFGVAASALTAADEVQNHPYQGHAQARPRREEVHEVDRPHARDGGPVEPGGEAEEPAAAADGGGEQKTSAEPFFAGAGHGFVSLSDVASPGTEPTTGLPSKPVPPPA